MKFLDRASIDLDRQIAIAQGYYVSEVAKGDFRLYKPNHAPPYPVVKGATLSEVWENAFKHYLPRYTLNSKALGIIAGLYSIKQVKRGSLLCYEARFIKDDKVMVGQGATEALALAAAFLSPQGDILETAPFTQAHYEFW